MTALQTIIKEAKVIWKKHPTLSWQEAIKKASIMYKNNHKPKKSGKAIAGKRIVKKSAPKKIATKKSTHKDTKSHNVNISGMGDVMRKNLDYGAVYDTSLQIYLVKFANLSFSLWAVTSEGLKKALKHPEGKNQSPIVYRVKNWGIPKFEKMKLSELKDFK